MRRLFSGWFGNHDTRVTIQVPTRTDVSLSTSGGSIRTSHVNGIVGVHTSGGGLDIDAIEGARRWQHQRRRHPHAGHPWQR
jgi:hypothetical protein